MDRIRGDQLLRGWRRTELTAGAQLPQRDVQTLKCQRWRVRDHTRALHLFHGLNSSPTPLDSGFGSFVLGEIFDLNAERTLS